MIKSFKSDMNEIFDEIKNNDESFIQVQKYLIMALKDLIFTFISGGTTQKHFSELFKNTIGDF